MPKELTKEQVLKRQIKSQIARLKFELHKTDYVASKLAEASAKGETEKVAELLTKYAKVLQDRESQREQIDSLREQL